MELAISSWSFHVLFLNNMLTADTFPRVVSEQFGIHAVEFFEGDFCGDVLDINEQYVGKIAQACQAAGTSVCCIAARNDLATEDDTAAEQDVERLKRWIDFAPLLGCKIIRINTGLLKPTSESLARARTRLELLLEAASQREVIFAVENHPHVVRGMQDLDLIMEFVESFADANVRTCPDMGSFSDEYRLEGFTRMSRCAGHVHAKAPLSDNEPGDLLLEYRPFINALNTNDYTGFVSLESVEMVDPWADPLAEVWRAAKALGSLMGQSLIGQRPSLDVVAPRSPSTVESPRIPQQETEIAESVLPIILEGCEHKLNAPTRMRSFPTNREHYSPLCGHLHTPTEFAQSTFCGIAQRDEFARSQCDQFYENQFNLIRQKGSLRRQVCFCPLGLAVLFLPLAQGGDLYGTLACGTWRESGTEGVILYGIDRCVNSTEIKTELEHTLLKIPELTSYGLLQARETLNGVAQDLAEFYHLAYQDQLARKQDLIIRELIEAMRGSKFRSMSSAAKAIVPVLTPITSFLGAMYLTVYQGEIFEGDQEMELEKLDTSTWSESELPSKFYISSQIIEQQDLFSKPDTLRTLADCVSPAPDFCYTFELAEKKLCVIICGGLFGSPDMNTHKSVLERVSKEIAYVLRNASRLDEAVQRQEQLRMIADQTRHQLNAPLQGIRGALGRLRSLLKSDGTRGQIDGTAMRADVFAQEAGNIVETLSRSSMDERVLGRRETPRFRKALLGPIIRRAAKPFKLAAREREINIKIAKSVYDLAAIECNSSQVEILFANLIDNAVKFSHANRPVSIRAKQQRLSLPEYPRKSEAVEIVVRNFGLGIPVKDLEKNIFKPYFQSSVPDETRPIGGMGLGLNVCREIVEQHGGQISASCKMSRAFTYGPVSISEGQKLQGCWVEFRLILPVSQAGRTQSK